MAGPKNMTHDESNIKNKALFKDSKQQRRHSLSINGSGITRQPCAKKRKNLNTDLQKNELKWITDLNVKRKITKPMEETIREHLDDLGDDLLLLLLLNH